MNNTYNGQLPDFGYKKLNSEGIARCNEVQKGFETLLGTLVSRVPPGRHQALVCTKLEEACFFAKKAIAHDKEFQEKAEVECVQG